MSSMEYEIAVNCPECGELMPVFPTDIKDGKAFVLCSNCAAENTVTLKDEHG